MAFNHKTLRLLMMLFSAFSFAGAIAQETMRDYGKQDFDKHCASCHGANGAGNGWLSHFLTQEPPDLTLLAKQNGGILPLERLYNSIAGNQIPIHGPSDMPAWGSTFITEAKDQNVGLLYDPEALAKARILLLLEYINRLQTQ